MLEKLLEEIKKSETVSPGELARRLNLSTALVQAMLETLEEQGYLKVIEAGDCDVKACGACSLAGVCLSKQHSNSKILALK